MRLYLIQHGEAKSRDEDPDRPLTEEGRRDVARGGIVCLGRDDGQWTVRWMVTPHIA